MEVARDPDRLETLIAEHGSPLNLIEPGPMGRNAAELKAAASARNVPIRIFFARKANKALSLVDEAKRLGHGIDVASERELRQVLDRGVAPGDVILTAAIKPEALLELCLESGVLVSIDNLDELRLLRSIASRRQEAASIAVRLAPVTSGGRPPTRFGLPQPEILDAAKDLTPARLGIAGVHFHLDGYDAGDRVEALTEALSLVDSLREIGHEPRFVDIGGGVPMSYFDDSGDWDAFWAEHERGLRGDRNAITFEGHELGTVYPYFQDPVRGEWLGRVLDAPLDAGTVADGLRDRELELRCEPGRSILDGCGMTAARVEFRKRRADGVCLVGLAMNRTQMRSTSDDFMVDPLLLRPSEVTEPTQPIEGYLVGAYCIERELLSWRRFSFPEGVAVGDIVIFPNTAGYLMHILESASHQIPLAKNLVLSQGGAALDPIDAP